MLFRAANTLEDSFLQGLQYNGTAMAIPYYCLWFCVCVSFSIFLFFALLLDQGQQTKEFVAVASTSAVAAIPRQVGHESLARLLVVSLRANVDEVLFFEEFPQLLVGVLFRWITRQEAGDQPGHVGRRHGCSRHGLQPPKGLEGHHVLADSAVGDLGVALAKARGGEALFLSDG
jgi:hypothetical protein